MCEINQKKIICPTYYYLQIILYAYPLALGLFFSGFSVFTVRSALQLLVLLTCFHIAVLLTSSVILMEVIGIFMIFPLARGMVRFPGNGGGFPQFTSCGIIQSICRNFTFLRVKYVPQGLTFSPILFTVLFHCLVMNAS